MPLLPPNCVNVIVSISPWVALVFGVLGVVSAVSASGLLSFLVPFGALVGAAIAFYLLFQIKPKYKAN